MSARRLAINARYRQLLADVGVSFMPVPDWSDWNGWLTCVVFDEPPRATGRSRRSLPTDIE